MLSNLYTIIIMAFTQQDTECMSLALKLSELGRASVGANPMVGCVITRDDKLLLKTFIISMVKGMLRLMLLSKLITKLTTLRST